jgi:DNA-binding MarR family transcriptional regulator
MENSPIELTGRQRAFLGAFLELYRENRTPLHYTAVAQRLGVSKITAYDMLRVLEERGLVQSEYVLRGKGQGAGRSTILFRPILQADALFTWGVNEQWDQTEWETGKTHLLEALKARKGTDYRDLLEEILARLPHCRSPMLYAAETITAVLLGLHQLKRDVSAAGLLKRLRSVGLPGEAGLRALAGLALGLSFAEGIDHDLAGQLLSRIGRYQEILSRLSVENLRRLSGFAGEVMKTVEA